MRFSVRLLCLLLTLSVVACGKNQNPQKIREIAVSSCMKQVSPTLSRYFQGNASEQETDGVFTCIQNSLQLFTERTQGQDHNSYTQAEIRKFVEQFMMDGRPIPASLLNEAMIFKAALLGGSADKLSKTEIAQTRSLLSTFQVVAKKLRSDLPIKINTSSETTLNHLSEVAQILGTEFSKSQQSYSLDHLFSFAREIQGQLHTQDLQYWIDHKGIVESGYKILLGSTTPEVKPSDWNTLFVTAAKAFKAGRYSQNLNDTFFDAAYDLLKDSLTRQKNEKLSVQAFLDWNQELLNAGISSVQVDFIRQLMTLKKKWIGGDENFITLTDLKSFYEWAPTTVKIYRFQNDHKNIIDGQMDLFSAKNNVLIKNTLDEALVLIADIQKLEAKNVGPKTIIDSTWITPFAHKVPVALIDEALALKASLVGGSSRNTTLQELKKLFPLLDDLRRQFIQVQSSLPYTEASVAPINAALNQTAQILSRSAKPYSWTHLHGLIEAFHRFQPNEATSTFLKREPFFRELLEIVALPNISQQIRPEDWKALAFSVTSAHKAVADLRVLSHSKEEIYSGHGLEAFKNITQEIYDLLDFAITQQPQATLTVQQLENIIALLKPEEVPLGLQATTFSKFMAPLTLRILSGINTTSLSRNEMLKMGLTHKSVKNLREQTDIFVNNQVFLSRFLPMVDCLEKKQRTIDSCALNVRSSLEIHALFDLRFTKQVLLKYLERKDVLSYLYLASSKEAEEAIIDDARELIYFAKPLYPNYGNQLAFPETGKVLLYNFNNFSHLNWLRILAKFLIRGYATDAVRAETFAGVTEEEAHVMIQDDLYDMGVELLLIDKRTLEVPKKRFLEGTHFVPSARGAETMDVSELSELVAFLQSGGAMANEINARVYEVCPTQSGKGFGFPYMNSECFRKFFYRDTLTNWSHIPNAAKFYNGLSEKDKVTFSELLEFAGEAHSVAVNKDWLTSADTRSMMVILQYIDAIVLRYDTNANGTINYQESEVAYKVFKNEIETLAKGVTNDYLLFSAFSYLLAKGEIPVAGSYDFNTWIITRLARNFESDRLNVLKIFAEIQRSVSAHAPAQQPKSTQAPTKK